MAWKVGVKEHDERVEVTNCIYSDGHLCGRPWYYSESVNKFGDGGFPVSRGFGEAEFVTRYSSHQAKESPNRTLIRLDSIDGHVDKKLQGWQRQVIGSQQEHPVDVALTSISSDSIDSILPPPSYQKTNPHSSITDPYPRASQRNPSSRKSEPVSLIHEPLRNAETLSLLPRGRVPDSPRLDSPPPLVCRFCKTAHYRELAPSRRNFVFVA
ncbi:hypothetical protein BDP55DRAFT_440712 [Colletotrichum godetiae]|uniref:Uncharacterized protein n=1 Tax=Colletotrichum godetiae TaxID=1209918 RepID=A0AAJ0A942_9PEZI|nr:uncharacterized protein BDP55DRAFT_440712 [Colletotrichum godetiae]KAK1657326.1 hypothetical protein BDP55DRAFT_440712 [Colletotrichum godetiae]